MSIPQAYRVPEISPLVDYVKETQMEHLYRHKSGNHLRADHDAFYSRHHLPTSAHRTTQTSRRWIVLRDATTVTGPGWHLGGWRGRCYLGRSDVHCRSAFDLDRGSGVRLRG